MRISTKAPIFVARHGRLAGVFFPRPESVLLLALKRELFVMLSSEVVRQIKKRGLARNHVLSDFESWRKNRRAARRKR